MAAQEHLRHVEVDHQTRHVHQGRYKGRRRAGGVESESSNDEWKHGSRGAWIRWATTPSNTLSDSEALRDTNR